MPRAELRPGDVLHDCYRIERQIGRGGMGGVYLATNKSNHLWVAIKAVVIPHSDPEEYRLAVQQFMREAEILVQLSHANIPHVHEFFVGEEYHYLVMDYIEGRNLAQVVAQEAASEVQVLRWGKELVAVLAYLHAQKPPIIFRDLKPTNIMLSVDGKIKLIDFGIAKSLDVETGRGTHTSVRGSLTPGFAAPEQYGTGTDPRSDIYALGATFYALLTRTVPPVSVEVASGSTVLKPLRSVRPDVSSDTARNIEWMLKVNRHERPADMAAVAKAFGFALPAPPPPNYRPLHYFLPHKLGKKAWVAASIGLLLLIGVVMAIAHGHSEPTVAPSRNPSVGTSP